jgi:hypothetical protein
MDVQPKKKLKQVADKAKAGYRDKDSGDRKKQVAQKSPGALPGVLGTYSTKGFEGMESEEDSKDELDEYEPEKVKNSGTNQKALKQQTGSRQNSAGGDRAMVLFATPLKGANPR